MRVHDQVVHLFLGVSGLRLPELLHGGCQCLVVIREEVAVVVEPEEQRLVGVLVRLACL